MDFAGARNCWILDTSHKGAGVVPSSGDARHFCRPIGPVPDVTHHHVPITLCIPIFAPQQSASLQELKNVERLYHSHTAFGKRMTVHQP
mmetsp:Transcript_48983/g.95777  ORF Transcript_48983/g.95777 Transcript_48983/m.95777 type:complete len:89 (-) Transcript_48983:116-382(-)